MGDTKGYDIATAIEDRAFVAALRSRRAAERDRAWRQLYAARADGIYRLVCCLGVAPGDVEDVVQRVFTIAHRRLHDAELDNIGPWLRGIAVKVSSDQRRFWRLRRLKHWLLRSTTEAATAHVPTPEQRLEQAETGQRAQDVLDRLSPKLREVLVLADLEQCKPAEVARLLGIPVNTVRSRRRLARERFIQLWERDETAEAGDA